LLAVGEQLIAFTLQLLQLRFQLGDLLLRIRYQALPFGEVAGVGFAATLSLCSLLGPG
jgi:hypothetical protein